jgi:quinoprotein glucose dehydrogenase
MRCFIFLSLSFRLLAQTDYRSWTAFGGGKDNIHYSSLRQIDRSNVSKLKVAWEYDTKDAFPGSDIQCNPIIVDGLLYAASPKLRIFALDAATGKEVWSFDGLNGQRPNHKIRGLTHWTDGKSSRILFSLGYQLHSLDAKTGRLDTAFGDGGKVDLRSAFDRDRDSLTISVPTPGAIYQDLIILGSSVPEGLPSTPGDIRAYNVRTGKLAWTFHTIPHPGEFGYETWPRDTWKHTGGANAWAGLVVDDRRGLVFVPTGSAAFDFYGGDRHGDNLFANTLLCLNAKTGERKWHFQAIRHDVWDLDFPSAPLLVTVKRDGRNVDAVAQAGKDGYLYLLDRETGKSLFPMKEIAVPASAVPGEKLAATQTIPLKPAPFTRQEFTADMITRRTPEAHAAMAEKLKGLNYGGRFAPPSERGTIVFPGFSGGAEWGGQAFDPQTRVFYINANEMPWVSKLIPPSAVRRTAKASLLYRARCGSCHGPDRKGAPPEYPALNHLQGRMSLEQIQNITAKGSGRMPGFANLGEDAIAGLAGFLLNGEDREVTTRPRGPKPPVELPFTHDGYNKFLDADGYPGITPPWGTLNAINLDTGEYLWRIPFGTYPELADKTTGAESHGGGIVTAGGLFFIGASAHDRMFRVYDKRNGKLLWETQLEFAANATPSMYEVKGKQYITLPLGGGRGKPSGGKFVTFALP